MDKNTQETHPSGGLDLVKVISRMAVDSDVGIAKLEKILDMQERIIDKNSRHAFFKSMSECQRQMPTVVKDKTNQQTNSKYATIESMLKTIKGSYTDHGFALTFGTAPSPIDRYIRITCDVMHAEGHMKEYFVDLPLDNAGIKGSVNKTNMHASASTFSYGKRYLITMIFNVTVAEHDNDGNFDPTEWINKISLCNTMEQLKDIHLKARESGVLMHIAGAFKSRRGEIQS